MADYLVEGNKTIRCPSGKYVTVPLNTTECLCPMGCLDCTVNHILLVSYNGAVLDKNGKYVY